MIRKNDTITGPLERPLLKWFCARLPDGVTSDILTAIGVTGAAISFVGYSLSGLGTGFIWLACLGLIINWFGDSLDGTLARHLKAERPKYGFFLDHMTDTFAMALVAIGIGLSPYANLTSAMAVLLGYLFMVILTMVKSRATDVFQVSYNGFGPTEIRLIIILFSIMAIFFPTPRWVWFDLATTIYDVIMLVAALLLTGACIADTIMTARSLAIVDPPRRRTP